MEIFIVVLILLTSIGVSNVINRFTPWIPVPLIQIALGIVLAVSPLGVNMPLDPELFMVLFIAPLLYNDGKIVKRDEIWKLRIPILLMSLGLVFTTVVIVGLVINKMIPSIPLSASFALAAILSPTDAVAVGALSERIHLPKQIMRLLEGEALMNDASGLVAFKFAVAATVSGVFSITHATFSFFVIAIGGVLCGIITAYLIIRGSKAIRRLGMEDATFHVLVQILTPFIIYMISEELGVSGILAVVAGGIVQSIKSDFTESAISKLKIVSSSTWSVILFILNGLVFLILGLQIPAVESVILKDNSISNVQVFIYILVISLTLIVLRFLWVYLFWNESWNIGKKKHVYKHKLKPSILTALSGVRGSVTLAGAFSIPYVLGNNEAFPERDLIIFIAAGVILFSLILASTVLPILSKGDKKLDAYNVDMLEKEIFRKVIRVGIKALNDDLDLDNKKATLSLISSYKKIIKNNFINKQEFQLNIQDRKIEKDILAIGLKAEHVEIKRLFKTGEISTCVMDKQEYVLNNMEKYLDRKIKFRVINKIILVRKIIKNLLVKSTTAEQANMQELKRAKILTSKAAIVKIKAQMNEENMKASFVVIDHYNEIIRKMNRVSNKDKDLNFYKQRRELQFKALQAQRNEVQSLFENNEITREIASKLRQFINYLEAIIIEEEIV
ncbi:Na+/H+ antiporter [Clostridium akagii]|uniref:Na+/H+ antiporter n=1 Tax=Clostridium akagii TaxID=91623 RepID=UPI000479E3AC|nr:Na+/H+ antiporter [Clostridium akagii]